MPTSCGSQRRSAVLFAFGSHWPGVAALNVRRDTVISGMGSAKNGIVRVGGADYNWRVHRQPTWTSGRSSPGHELLGLAILVEPPEPRRRSLVLEFDIDPTRHGDMPHHQRFIMSDGRLIEAIQSAMDAGWDPDSRGKRFVYEAGPLQPR